MAPTLSRKARSPSSVRAAYRKASRRSPPGRSDVGHDVLRVVLRHDAIYVGVGNVRDMLDQIADAVAVDLHAQADLGLDLVAFGHGHLPHVVAEPGDLQIPHFAQARGGSHPSGDAILNLLILPVPDDDLPRLAQSGAEESELAVAVGRLVQVHEIHVDRRPGQITIELRVQVGQRLGQGRQSGDPHLGRREGVHPGDHADAMGRSVGIAADVKDRFRRRDDRLEDDAQGQPRGGAEPLDQTAAVFGHLAKSRLAVKVLTAGDEPDFQGIHIHEGIRCCGFSS